MAVAVAVYATTVVVTEAQRHRRRGSTWGDARDDVHRASGALQHIS